MRDRPRNFKLNRNSPLAAGLQFLGASQIPGSTLYRDSSLYHSDGTLTNGPTWDWSPELGRRFVRFDGSDDYIQISPATPIPSPPFSFGCWFYGTNFSARALVGESNTAGAFQLRFEAANNVLAYVNGQERTQAALSVTTGRWYHLAYTRKANAVGASAFYLDGISQTLTIDSASAIAPLGSAWQIGSRAGTGEFWSGGIADWGMFSRALSPNEIAALADPSNVLLEVGGVPLLQPIRRLWAGWVPSGAPASNIPVFMNHFRRQRSAA